jgi:DNA-binding transcriptional ArsR family regulator
MYHLSSPFRQNKFLPRQNAHPEGLVVNEIQCELEIPNSTLSHHLEKLKNEDLVRVQRQSIYVRFAARNLDGIGHE